ncbi:MAG TPA: hypothetical protein P5539_05490 [Mesotoga sp.]|nr:hypothetical protein [Mesotoga sp.]
MLEYIQSNIQHDTAHMTVNLLLCGGFAVCAYDAVKNGSIYSGISAICSLVVFFFIN